MDFNYVFKGVLDLQRSMYSVKRTSVIIKDIVSSRGFLDGLTWTFTTCLLYTVLMTTTIKLIRVIMIYNTNKKINDNA